MDQDKIPIRCKISTSDSDAALGIRVSLDGQVIFEKNHVTNTENFECWLDNTEQQHDLQFEMFGKTAEHTKIDSSHNIIQDAHLSISEFSLDDIDLASFANFDYCHDFNGTGNAVTDKFYGYLGCNGTVTVKFTTPIYLWLLENL